MSGRGKKPARSASTVLLADADVLNRLNFGGESVRSSIREVDFQTDGYSISTSYLNLRKNPPRSPGESVAGCTNPNYLIICFKHGRERLQIDSV